MKASLHANAARRAIRFLADVEACAVDLVFEHEFRTAETAVVLIDDKELMFFLLADVLFTTFHSFLRIL